MSARLHIDGLPGVLLFTVPHKSITQSEIDEQNKLLLDKLDTSTEKQHLVVDLRHLQNVSDIADAFRVPVEKSVQIMNHKNTGDVFLLIPKEAVGINIPAMLLKLAYFGRVTICHSEDELRAALSQKTK